METNRFFAQHGANVFVKSVSEMHICRSVCALLMLINIYDIYMEIVGENGCKKRSIFFFFLFFYNFLYIFVYITPYKVAAVFDASFIELAKIHELFEFIYYVFF